MANLLTLIRVGLIFAVVAVWARDVHGGWWALDLAMVPLLAWAIFMDAVDGWVARARHEESDVGALFDIAGDRVVELVLWVFFAIRLSADGAPFVPYWVPLVIIARTVLTDFVRSVAFATGRTPFGEATMQASAWGEAVDQLPVEPSSLRRHEGGRVLCAGRTARRGAGTRRHRPSDARARYQHFGPRDGAPLRDPGRPCVVGWKEVRA